MTDSFDTSDESASTQGDHDSLSRRKWLGPILLGVGAAFYAIVQGAADITFNATPLTVGIIAMIAGLASGIDRLVPIGLTLVGWGTAVMLVREGPLPDDREAPSFMIGVAIGLLLALLYGRRVGVEITGAIVTAIVGGISFYLAFDVDEVFDWPLWAIAIALWAAFEAARLAWISSNRSPG